MPGTEKGIEILARQCEHAPWAVSGTVRLEYRSRLDGRVDWSLALPGRGDTWIVCLHGHGSHGDQLFTRIDLRADWVPAFRGRGLGILAPNLRDNAWMGPRAAHDLRHLLEYARTGFEARRFLFFSGSMGGTGSLIFAGLHPGLTHGVVALCPAADLSSYHRWCRSNQAKTPVLGEIADAIETAYRGTPAANPQVYRAHSALANAPRLQMPLVVVHGSGDRTIPVEQSRRLAERLARTSRFAYLEIPGGNHDSPLHGPVVTGALDQVLEQM
ncbi:MAG: prolyl oligopeptidase family serine peptidase [Kiritimatiellaeota bacterium]|nr:prolyl oligopeptidase family serine peptidase [Kiritimatiellota bacterium]